MFYRPNEEHHGLKYNPIKALVVPRPIGWIGTFSKEGIPNLAPYSFFNLISETPAMLMFCPAGVRDSRDNCEETDCFSYSMVPTRLQDQMMKTASIVPPEVDEFELADLKMEQCQLINAPKVEDAPISMECKVHQVIDLPSTVKGKRNSVVIGMIEGIYINDAFIKEGIVDTEAMQPLARVGYKDYSSIRETYSLSIPQ